MDVIKMTRKSINLSGKLVGSHKARELTSARQKGGRLAPVFKSILTGSTKEEAYVARMVRKDCEENLWGGMMEDDAKAVLRNVGFFLAGYWFHPLWEIIFDTFLK